MYNRGSVLVCSQKLACLAVTFGFLSIISVALIIAFTKPGCPDAIYTGEPIAIYKSAKTDSSSFHYATNGEKFPWLNTKLPNFIQPIFYSIFLHPNVTTNRIKGNVTILLTAREETKFLVLHSNELNISYYALQDKYLERVNIAKFLIYPYHQQIYIGLSRILHRGSNYTLNFIYETTFEQKHSGIFHSTYQSHDGDNKSYLYTNFQPTYARSAFPCFDEPHFKARFQISLIRNKNEFGIFNAPLRSSSYLNSSCLMVDEFEPTAEMSSYLVSFIIGNFANVSKSTKNGVIVSVCSRPQLSYLSDNALEIAIEIIDYLESFFGIDFPLPKLDLIAVPNFRLGSAMENWGLITFSENILMVNPEETPVDMLQEINRVFVHELAHQWFGNLVTMEWWHDLWLSEGFVTLMEDNAIASIKSNWSMVDQFMIDRVQPALARDALYTVYPVSYKVWNPSDIFSIFDSVSYKKSAVLVGMLEMLMGSSTMKSGLKCYLAKYIYSNADSTKFLSCLMESTNDTSAIDILAFMERWTVQAGFPVVSVDIQSNMITANQTRFVSSLGEVIDPNLPTNETTGYRWQIPLTYVTSASPENVTTVWMDFTDVSFSTPNDFTWIKFNVGQRGFYRVDYGESGWKMLNNLLKEDHGALSATDRASVIDDAFALARFGYIDLQIPLQISKYLGKETSYIPWHTALSHFSHWAFSLNGHSSYNLMLNYVCSLIEPHYQRLGWKDEGSNLEKLLRSKILSVAIDCWNKDAIEKALSLFAAWRDKGEIIPVNLRSVVYITGVRHGSKSDWDFCYHMYKKSSLPTERQLLLRALSHTVDPWVLQLFLERHFEGPEENLMDVELIMTEISSNPSGQLLAWRLLRKHWSRLSSTLQRNPFGLGNIIKSVTSNFQSDFDLNEVEAFFTDVDLSSAKHAFDQAIEMTRLNIEWRDTNLLLLSNWLRKEVEL